MGRETRMNTVGHRTADSEVNAMVLGEWAGERYRYLAFISYRREQLDRRWAKWLHRSLGNVSHAQTAGAGSGALAERPALTPRRPLESPDRPIVCSPPARRNGSGTPVVRDGVNNSHLRDNFIILSEHFGGILPP